MSRVEFVVQHVPLGSVARAGHMQLQKACLAVDSHGAIQYLEYCAALFAALEQFFDDATIDKPPRDLHHLAFIKDLLRDRRGRRFPKLEFSSPNPTHHKYKVSHFSTQALMLVQVKHHSKAQGVHVWMPTVRNGIEAVQTFDSGGRSNGLIFILNLLSPWHIRFR